MVKYSRSPTQIENTIAVSMGDSPPDLFISGGSLVNTLTGEIYKADIAITENRIARAGDISDLTSKYQYVQQLDASGSYLIPGLIDSHLHTESTLMTPTHFAEVALPRGTTSVVVDPHEIGNVLGIPGLELYIKEAANVPLDFMVEIPSCVPAAPTLENGPHTISAEEYIPLLQRDEFFALAEMMNFPGVIYRDEEVMKKLSYAEKADKIREGHAPGLRGKELQAYVSAGIWSDHESFTVDEVVEKLRAGMKIQLREGSFARNLIELASGIKEKMGKAHNAWDQVIICTDDKHVDDIYEQGHLDHSLRLLVNEIGIDPITAVRICSLNPAMHLRRPDLGAIAPGRLANIVRVDNLTDFKVQDVISQGTHVAHNHKLLVEFTPPQYPQWAMNTVKPNYIPTPKDFFISGPNKLEDGNADAHIIGVIEHSLVTNHIRESVKIENNRVVLSEDEDLAYYFLLDRHGNTKNFAKSLVKGFGFTTEGAVASTVAHDSHQLLMTGNSPEAMEFAMKELIRVKGGQIIVKKINGGFESEVLPLPYAGLMSIESPSKVAEKMTKMKKFGKDVCPGISEPFMSLSFMALPVIPQLKLSDKGLVDVDKFEIIDIFD